MATDTLDPIDRQIIRLLATDARMPLAELGKRVLLSRNAVRQRLSRLERDGHIGGYTIVPGTRSSAIGRSVTAYVLVYREDRMRGGGVLAAIEAVPEVVLCEVLSGQFDLVVRLEASTMDRLGEIWEDIARIPGVRDTVTAVALSRVVDKRALTVLPTSTQDGE